MKLPPGKYNVITVGKSVTINDDDTMVIVETCIVVGGPNAGDIIDLGETISIPKGEEP